VIKKTLQADLENERTTFFLLGFIVVLSTFFVVLEWTTEASLSPDWEGFSPLYMEDAMNEALVPAPETSPLSPDEPVAAPEAKPESRPVVYEDFNIVNKVPDTQEAMSELFAEADSKETDAPPEKVQTLQEISEQVYTTAEMMPQYPGGYTELNRYLFANLRYPPSAYTQRIQGRIWCSFIVNKDGSVSDIQVERAGYFAFNDEALRILKLMPSWIPGTIRGKAVRVKIYLPVVFKL
jgi:protein TonB